MGEQSEEGQGTRTTEQRGGEPIRSAEAGWLLAGQAQAAAWPIRLAARLAWNPWRTAACLALRKPTWRIVYRVARAQGRGTDLHSFVSQSAKVHFASFVSIGFHLSRQSAKCVKLSKFPMSISLLVYKYSCQRITSSPFARGCPVRVDVVRVPAGNCCECWSRQIVQVKIKSHFLQL